MSLRSMQSELRQWGQWARSTESNCGCAAYVSPSYTLLKLKIGSPAHKNGCDVLLDDDALLAIDALVQQLKLSKPTLFEFIRMYYLKGWTVQYMSDQSGVDRRTIDKYLMAAETWLDCRLESLCESLLTA